MCFNLLSEISTGIQRVGFPASRLYIIQWHSSAIMHVQCLVDHFVILIIPKMQEFRHVSVRFKIIVQSVNNLEGCILTILYIIEYLVIQ